MQTHHRLPKLAFCVCTTTSLVPRAHHLLSVFPARRSKKTGTGFVHCQSLNTYSSTCTCEEFGKHPSDGWMCGWVSGRQGRRREKRKEGGEDEKCVSVLPSQSQRGDAARTGSRQKVPGGLVADYTDNTSRPECEAGCELTRGWRGGARLGGSGSGWGALSDTAPRWPLPQTHPGTRVQAPGGRTQDKEDLRTSSHRFRGSPHHPLFPPAPLSSG